MEGAMIAGGDILWSLVGCVELPQRYVREADSI